MLALRAAPVLALLAAAGVAPAQETDLPDVAYPTLPGTAADAEGFVSAGWRLERQAEGDLDADGISDLAFVLRMQDPANILANDGLGSDTVDTNPRILGVAFRSGNGYRLAVQNHSLIPRHEMATQADPFSAEDTSFEVVRGALRLSLYRFMNAGGWDAGSTIYTFRWQDDGLRLIGYDYANVHRGSGCLSAVSVNFLTRRAKVTSGNIASDAEQVRWHRMPARPLLSIDEVDDDLMYDPSRLVEGFPPECGE